jgi:hypothetical protein
MPGASAEDRLVRLSGNRGRVNIRDVKRQINQWVAAVRLGLPMSQLALRKSPPFNSAEPCAPASDRAATVRACEESRAPDIKKISQRKCYRITEAGDTLKCLNSGESMLSWSVSLCRLLSALLCLAWCSKAFWQASPSPTQAQPQGRSQTGPTLSETATWLNQHLVGLAWNYERKQVRLNRKGEPDEKHAIITPISETVTTARVSGCQVEFSIERRTNDVTGSPLSTLKSYRVPLDSVNTSNVSPQNNRENHKSEKFLVTTTPTSYSQLEIGGDRDVISKSETTVYSSGAPNRSDSEMTSFAFIKSDDAELLKRVAKAVAHAIDICRGPQKPDIF